MFHCLVLISKEVPTVPPAAPADDKKQEMITSKEQKQTGLISKVNKDIIVEGRNSAIGLGGNIFLRIFSPFRPMRFILLHPVV